MPMSSTPSSTRVCAQVAGEHLASIDEALAYCSECLPRFVLCEKLVGQEFSCLSFTDGEHLAHMPAVQVWNRE